MDRKATKHDKESTRPAHHPMDRSNHTDGALTKTVGATCKVPQCRRFEHDPTSARDQSGCVPKRGGGPGGPSKSHMRRQDIPPALDLVATYSHGWCTVTLMLHFMIKLYHTQWYCTARPLGCLTTIESSSRPATLSGRSASTEATRTFSRRR